MAVSKETIFLRRVECAMMAAAVVFVNGQKRPISIWAAASFKTNAVLILPEQASYVTNHSLKCMVEKLLDIKIRDMTELFAWMRGSTMTMTGERLPEIQIIEEASLY